MTLEFVVRHVEDIRKRPLLVLEREVFVDNGFAFEALSVEGPFPSHVHAFMRAEAIVAERKGSRERWSHYHLHQGCPQGDNCRWEAGCVYYNGEPELAHRRGYAYQSAKNASSGLS